MKVFLDTNVVIDFCAHRAPFFQPAACIVDMGYRGEIDIAISALTFINVAYIEKGFPKRGRVCETGQLGGAVRCLADRQKHCQRSHTPPVKRFRRLRAVLFGNGLKSGHNSYAR